MSLPSPKAAVTGIVLAIVAMAIVHRVQPLRKAVTGS